MGFLNTLLSALGDSGPTCPACGGALDGRGMKEGSYWCDTCSRLVITYAGELSVAEPGDPRILEDSAAADPSESCASCQASLSGGERWLPYERGDNSQAIIECPSCGYENTRDGFGE